MSKAVLLSLHPKWCEKMCNKIGENKDGSPIYEKRVEVRKSRPKLDTPFPVYIYQTKKTWVYNIFSKIADWQGKVIGEFVCDFIRTEKEVACGLADAILVNASCVDAKDLIRYANGKFLYGWHISSLVIYDKPKELSEFYIIDNEAVKQCEHRERVYTNPDYTNGACLWGSYVCNKGETVWCTKCKVKPITKPPQSWCYVEELRE